VTSTLQTFFSVDIACEKIHNLINNLNTNDQHHFYLNLGREIRDRRGKCARTQVELAEALGLTRTSVVNIEAGRQKLLLHHIYDLAEFFSCSAGDLLANQAPVRTERKFSISIPEELPSEMQQLMLRAIKNSKSK
jgi:DNA-binding XRE family transcriptional regulator